MSHLRPLAFAALLAVPLAAPAAAQQPPKLTDRTYAKLRDYVLPSREEDRWRDVGWRATHWDAVVEAQKKEMPILLWTMNGHPLGHT